jgi:hypothetical protein
LVSVAASAGFSSGLAAGCPAAGATFDGAPSPDPDCAEDVLLSVMENSFEYGSSDLLYPSIWGRQWRIAIIGENFYFLYQMKIMQ